MNLLTKNAFLAFSVVALALASISPAEAGRRGSDAGTPIVITVETKEAISEE